MLIFSFPCNPCLACVFQRSAFELAWSGKHAVWSLVFLSCSLLIEGSQVHGHRNDRHGDGAISPGRDNPDDLRGELQDVRNPGGRTRSSLARMWKDSAR